MNRDRLFPVFVLTACYKEATLILLSKAQPKNIEQLLRTTTFIFKPSASFSSKRLFRGLFYVFKSKC